MLLPIESSQRILRPSRLALFGLLLLFCGGLWPLGCPGGGTPRATIEEGHARAAEVWLVGQIHPENHLLRSYDQASDTAAWLYDQAVGAIALLRRHREREARDLLDRLGQLLDQSMAGGGPAALADGYDWTSGDVLPGSGTRAVGPNAWLGLAFLHGYRRLGDAGYLQRARDVASWIVANLRIEAGPLAGAFRGGLDPAAGLLPWVSTEHNADMLAFLRALEEVRAAPMPGGEDWARYADALERWIYSPTGEYGLWNAKESHFQIGYESIDPPVVSHFNEWLDSQTWTLLAGLASSRVTGTAYPANRNGLGWMASHWLVTVHCGARARRGFAKRTTDTGGALIASYWTEGMAGYAVARELAPAEGGSELAPEPERVVADLQCFQQPNGGVLYSRGETESLRDHFGPDERPIAIFSSDRNLLGGEVGVYGDALPDWANRESRSISWFYSAAEVGQAFDPAGVRSPEQSFLLVNDANRSDRYSVSAGTSGWNASRSAWRPYNWASFSLGLVPPSGDPSAPISRDLSGYEELRFWARAAASPSGGGVSIRVFVRDANDHLSPTAWGLSDAWTQIAVDLHSIPGVDLEHASGVGLSFGREVYGVPLNEAGASFWIDDFSLAPSDEPLPEPSVYPNNWPWGSVAATAWYIFALDDFNPFVAGED